MIQFFLMLLIAIPLALALAAVAGQSIAKRALQPLEQMVLYRSSTLHDMTLGGPLREGEGDAGFNERLVRLSDGSHAFVVSHIHTMQGRTVVIRLGYDLGPCAIA